MKHRHAELMKMYAEDAMETDKPWERWQVGSHTPNVWLDMTIPIKWDADRYRRKPKTIKYRVALMDGGKLYNTFTATQNIEDLFNLEDSRDFIKWLTDWVEVEI